MPRKPTPKATRPASPPLPGTQLQAAQLAAAAVTTDAIPWLYAAKRAGHVQTHAFYAAVADRALMESYAEVKESKTYIGMPYLDESGKLKRVSALEEYCQVFLGKSYRRCEQLLSNRHLLGPALYEQAEELGLGQRDYNALKALPAKSQEIIKAAIEGKDDRKTVVEKLVKLVEQQQVEKAAIATERDKAVNQYESREKVIEAGTKKLSDLKEKLARIPREKPDEKGKAMILEVAAAAQETASDINHITKACDMLLQHAAGASLDLKPYRAAIEHHMGHVIEELGDLISMLLLVGMESVIAPLRLAMQEEAP